jgi:acetyl-CoA carboxylase biotin carboxyl carrier protein
MGLDDEDVREILRIIDESELDELRIDTEGFSLSVRRGPAGEKQPLSPAPIKSASEPASAEHAAAVSAPAAFEENGKLTIESPMLGTFYRAEGPSQDPFVEVGSAVEADSTVCIIEVMKMINSHDPVLTVTTTNRRKTPTWDFKARPLSSPAAHRASAAQPQSASPAMALR